MMVIRVILHENLECVFLEHRARLASYFRLFHRALPANDPQARYRETRGYALGVAGALYVGYDSSGDCRKGRTVDLHATPRSNSICKGLNSARILFTCNSYEYHSTTPAKELSSYGLDAYQLNRPDRMQVNSTLDRPYPVKDPSKHYTTLWRYGSSTSFGALETLVILLVVYSALICPFEFAFLPETEIPRGAGYRAGNENFPWGKAQGGSIGIPCRAGYRENQRGKGNLCPRPALAGAKMQRIPSPPVQGPAEDRDSPPHLNPSTNKDHN
ncbi:hypothetical protein Sjap_007962 [Stephania japonica]|uniref:Uncharacterized protein n=1 Tax=Stephania japonica TaxID=461633 RepID=A0AAP0JNL0_9MAGN